MTSTSSSLVSDVVVQTLRDEHEVGETKICCEGDDGGYEIGPESAGEVGDVAEEPDG